MRKFPENSSTNFEKLKKKKFVTFPRFLKLLQHFKKLKTFLISNPDTVLQETCMFYFSETKHIKTCPYSNLKRFLKMEFLHLINRQIHLRWRHRFKRIYSWRLSSAKKATRRNTSRENKKERRSKQRDIENNEMDLTFLCWKFNILRECNIFNKLNVLCEKIPLAWFCEKR